MYFGNMLGASSWTVALIIILIVENLQSYANSPGAIKALIFSIPGLLIAMTFHEYAHAFVADKLGDDTPRREGRLTLNPLAHIEPIGMIMLLFAGFGWGKPVEIDPRNFNRTVSVRKGNAIVALAGPLINIILAIIFSIVYGILLLIIGKTGHLSTAMDVILTIIEYTISMNVGLGVFNLIPLPPLDGSKILTAFLPVKARNWYESHEQILYLVFIILWITPFASLLITPAVRAINSGLISLISLIAGY